MTYPSAGTATGATAVHFHRESKMVPKSFVNVRPGQVFFRLSRGYSNQFQCFAVKVDCQGVYRKESHTVAASRPFGQMDQPFSGQTSFEASEVVYCDP